MTLIKFSVTNFSLGILSNYDGEFGFDEGDDFKDNSVPKLQMQYNPYG
jgi:hypothetical protein